MAGKTRLTKNDRLAILQSCAEGYTDEQIARLLGISDRTIRRICERYMRVSETKNRTHLIAWAIVNGHIKPRLEAK